MKPPKGTPPKALPSNKALRSNTSACKKKTSNLDDGTRVATSSDFSKVSAEEVIDQLPTSSPSSPQLPDSPFESALSEKRTKSEKARAFAPSCSSDLVNISPISRSLEAQASYAQLSEQSIEGPYKGPFQVHEDDESAFVKQPLEGGLTSRAPRRNYNCDHYECCLEVAAALNWESFTCMGCCGEFNEKLVWQAHLAQKADALARKLCELPKIACFDKDSFEKADSLEPGSEKLEEPSPKEQGSTSKAAANSSAVGLSAVHSHSSKKSE